MRLFFNAWFAAPKNVKSTCHLFLFLGGISSTLTVKCLIHQNSALLFNFLITLIYLFFLSGTLKNLVRNYKEKLKKQALNKEE